LTKWIELYTSDFNYNRYQHDSLKNWFDQLSDQGKILAIDNISNIIKRISLDPRNNNNVYDRRIVYEYRDANDKLFLLPINTIALNGLANFSNYSLNDKLEKDFIYSMTTEYPNKTKGSIVEYFIIQKIVNERKRMIRETEKISFTFKVHVGGGRRYDDLIISDYDVEYFDGIGAPPAREINKNTIFIPYDPSYPAFDLFYYENGPKSSGNICSPPKLFCIQITITQTPMKHVETNDTQFKQETPSRFKKSMIKWKKLLKDTTEFFEIWMGKKQFYENDNQQISKKDSLNVIYLEEHVELFRQN
jgi:hypothetical protein